MDKPILQTTINKDGSKWSQVWCPFWGSKPKKKNADKVKETESHIEFIYYANKK